METYKSFKEFFVKEGMADMKDVDQEVDKTVSGIKQEIDKEKTRLANKARAKKEKEADKAAAEKKKRENQSESVEYFQNKPQVSDSFKEALSKVIEENPADVAKSDGYNDSDLNKKITDAYINQVKNETV